MTDYNFKDLKTNRASGILMHISSLPSPYGIGSFGKDAYDFVDFLYKAGQVYWQVLPLGPTSFGDSPYQSFSSFAGNPYFIDLDLLYEDGLLSKDDYINIDFGKDKYDINYSLIYKNKMEVLKKAYYNAKNKFKYNFENFKVDQGKWLDDYAIFMSIKEEFNNQSWLLWDRDIKLRKKESLDYYKEKLKDEIEYWKFLQFIFFKQWSNLKEYANSKGIKIIGDIPIYVAEDSADTWANSHIFLLNENKEPIRVGGCPPDGFSDQGQLWGNPIYRWDELEKENYKWWLDRIEGNMRIFDLIRIDHFRGFESYWSIPYGDKNAVGGKWVKGPGIKLFKAIKEGLGDVNIIAEDLGYMTREVRDFRNKTGFPGMKILQFAFSVHEESDYLPHNYDENWLVYTGTHDNEPIKGWLDSAPQEEVNHAIEYLRLDKEEGYNWGFLRGAWASVAFIAIGQMQDFLNLGSQARMNLPSTIGTNWRWRVDKASLNDKLAERIYKMTKLYGRLNKC